MNPPLDDPAGLGKRMIPEDSWPYADLGQTGTRDGQPLFTQPVRPGTLRQFSVGPQGSVGEAATVYTPPPEIVAMREERARALAEAQIELEAATRAVADEEARVKLARQASAVAALDRGVRKQQLKAVRALRLRDKAPRGQRRGV